MDEREFDIVVYGSTGFTGRLVAEYLNGNYGDDIKWAMAGRSEDKLKTVRDETGMSEDIPLVVADSDRPETLADMAARTGVVLTTVGPYQLYGTDVVKACVEAGTDYVDLSGEPAWMHDMIGDFDARARETCARIVHSCGFDSIPFDLGVYYIQQAAREKFGTPCSRVRGRVRKVKGTFSGGTAASFMQTMRRARQQPEVLDWLRDPFSLVPYFSGPPQPTGHKPVYEDDLNSWSAPFIMASTNTKNVHRSNALMGHTYGKDFVYDEMMLTGPGDKGEQMAYLITNDKSMAENTLKPGEGPSKEERETGFYDIMFVGETEKGERVIGAVTGDKDPGYGSTSKMITESALCLAQDVARYVVGGGVYTPAPVMAKPLIARLTENAGLKFSIEA
ncbi:MAG: saccharopine dehydrogenase NADP-binding domain-containing protein [Hyphomonadaceae bacterium]|nr:saccharopine dehydrogenase NADP-binding domain-containing protein [Hyphomonadaceae bacterium]